MKRGVWNDGFSMGLSFGFIVLGYRLGLSFGFIVCVNELGLSYTRKEKDRV